MVFNNLIWDQGINFFSGEWYNLMTHSQSIIHHYYFMVQQIKEEKKIDDMYGRG